MQEYLRRLLEEKARLKKWKKIMIALSCIVVVCTVYALSLPAQTLACNKEEHTHTAECYDENNALICEKEEHTHTDDCNKQEEVVEDEPETQNDDEQVSQVSEEETTTTETTTEPFDLSSDANKYNIKSFVIYYKDSDNKWQNLDKGDAKPNSTELYLKVDFDKIDTKNLLEQHNGILVYSLPDFMRDFEKAGNGNLLAGERNIGTIEIENNQVKITLKKDYLNELVTNSSNQLDGSFYVKGQIDLTKINQNNGEAKLVVGNKTVTLNYGPDCIEKFGSVDMKKEMSNVDKVNNYLTYTVTVTAGKDGCKDLYVVDKFTSNANLVSYAGNISSTETTLTSEDNNKDPFETIISGATHGKIYKASIPDATTKIPDAGVSDITNPCIVWHIGDMKPNESRTLTYYVKLNDKANLSGQTIKNNASLYSKSSKDIYEKKVDDKNRNADFTPKIDYKNQFTKTVDGNIIRNTDGSYTIPFKSYISIHEDTSNYTIKNLQFYDYLKHDINTDIDADLLQYIHFDQNSFELHKDNKLVDSKEYNIKWSTDNTNFKEWNDKDNFRSFVLSGNEDTPINLSPGESCYITYNVIVKPEVFAKLHTDSINAFNRFIAHADNVDKKSNFADGFEACFISPTIKTYEWNGKQVEQTATTSQKVTMSRDRFIYENNKIIKDLTSNTSFTIPEGSYKYTVETNKTLNDFNVNEVTMTDTLTSKHMKYVGYMKVEALKAEINSQELQWEEATQNYKLQPTYNVVETKWVKIDGQKTFSLKPSELGWTDKNYAYRFTYYAKPDNLDAFTETKVKNKFTLDGVVKKGDGTFTFNKEDVSKETTLTIKGNLNLNANKQSWYYKEPDSNTWTNGELYWVVDIGGTKINKDMVFRDLIKTGDGITPSNLREGSLVGIYKGTLKEGKNISNYKDIEDLKNKSGLTPINDKFISQLNGTNELLLTAKEDIQLGNDKVYMIIKSEPSELPSPTNNRDTKTFKNSISIEEDGEYVSEIPAEKTLYTSPKILKELGQVFKYDGTRVTTLQIGADKKNNGDADPSKIDTKLLDNSKGVFISWAFKVNYDGQLSGDYDVIDDIPDGMEFSYMRVKWHGDEASQVKSKTIENFDSSTWEQKYNDSTNDNKNSEHTIYYVSKDKKRTKIRLGEFVSKSIRDNNSVDVQVVCRITDSQVLLGAQPSDFINKVTLQKYGQNIATSSSQIPVQLAKTDKNIDKELATTNGQKLDFEINTNQLGQTLPTNDNGGLTLVDKLGDNLRLDTTSVKVYKNNNEEVTGCVIAYQDKTLEISNIPNDVPIKIRYTVTVNMKPGDPVNIANTAYWKGYSENGGDTVLESYSYSVSGTIGASSVVNFKLTKQDQNDLSKVLSGATFKIEKCEFDGSGNMTTSDISTETTNESGTITKNLEYNTLYKITETKAPDDYVLDTKPIYILDVKKGNESYVDTVKQYLKNINLEVSYQEENFNLQVRNHKGEITVVKKFINDAAGKSTKPVSGTYRFGLYDDPNKLDKPLQPPKTITYSANDNPDKSVKFENLELNKTYYVYELDDQDKPITDTSKEVTINTMNYQVVYKNETQNTDTSSAQNGETIVVTNKSRTKILPSTGGTGNLIYRMSGTALVVVGVISLSIIDKKKRKKKVGESNEIN